MDTKREYAQVSFDAQGRVEIPARLRQTLGIRPGDELIAYVEENGLVLQRREAILDEIESLFAGIPADVSLVDELLAERRDAARREAAD